MVLKMMLFMGCVGLNLLLSVNHAYAKVTVYDFGASWCGPCKEDIARDNELQRELGPNVQFVFVDEDVDTNKADAFLRSANPQIEVRRDPDHSFARKMGAVNKTPSTVIVGSKGNVEVINGSLSKEALKSKIQSHK